MLVGNFKRGRVQGLGNEKAYIFFSERLFLMTLTNS